MRRSFITKLASASNLSPVTTSAPNMPSPAVSAASKVVGNPPRMTRQATPQSSSQRPPIDSPLHGVDPSISGVDSSIQTGLMRSSGRDGAYSAGIQQSMAAKPYITKTSSARPFIKLAFASTSSASKVIKNLARGGAPKMSQNIAKQTVGKAGASALSAMGTSNPAASLVAKATGSRRVSPVRALTPSLSSGPALKGAVAPKGGWTRSIFSGGKLDKVTTPKARMMSPAMYQAQQAANNLAGRANQATGGLLSRVTGITGMDTKGVKVLGRTKADAMPAIERFKHELATRGGVRGVARQAKRGLGDIRRAILPDQYAANIGRGIENAAGLGTTVAMAYGGKKLYDAGKGVKERTMNYLDGGGDPTMGYYRQQGR